MCRARRHVPHGTHSDSDFGDASDLLRILDEPEQLWPDQRTGNEVAHAIISRCDGIAPLEAVVADLCSSFPGAPREMIEKDVIALVQNFVDKNVMQA